MGKVNENLINTAITNRRMTTVGKGDFNDQLMILSGRIRQNNDENIPMSEESKKAFDELMESFGKWSKGTGITEEGILPLTDKLHALKVELRKDAHAARRNSNQREI